MVNRIRGRLLDLQSIRGWEKNPDVYSSAASRAAFTAGRSMPISTAMMTMTTSSSTSVNARRPRGGPDHCFAILADIEKPFTKRNEETTDTTTTADKKDKIQGAWDFRGKKEKSARPRPCSVNIYKFVNYLQEVS